MIRILFILLLLPMFSNGQGNVLIRNDSIFIWNSVTQQFEFSRKTMPSQAGQAGKVLGTTGTDYIWQAPPGAAWGGITGTLSDQSDLQTALNGKQATLVSGTNIKTVNGNSLLGSGNVAIGGAPTFINLAANFSSTSTTPAVVTGWSFAVTNGVTYRIEVIADYQTAATTTGGIIGISLTNSATGSVRGWARGSVSAAAVATELAIPIRATSGAGSTLTTTAVSATNTPHFVSMVITFTCTASGTFNIVWGSEINGSASQLNANSSLIYQALN